METTPVQLAGTAHINWLFFRETDNFESALDELIKILTTDIDHVKFHTRLTCGERMEEKESKSEFLLRGDELRIAEGWLAISRIMTRNLPISTQRTSKRARRNATAVTRRRRLVSVTLTASLIVALG